MECPYCKKEMRAGVIPGYRGRVEWIEDDLDPWFGAERGLRLSEPRFMTAERAEAHYCPDCRIVLVPVRDYEEPLAKADRKLKDFTDKLERRRKEYEAQRAEEKQEKRRAERRKKDPWEVD